MEYSLSYDLFLFEEAINQIHMEEYINECIILSHSSHSIKEISFIQEAFKEKLKETWDKLILAIQKVWARFIANTEKFIKGDIEYLKKYRSVVFDNKLKEETYTMYKYWEGYDSLKNDKIPPFNFAKVITLTEDTIYNDLPRKYITKDKPVIEMAKYIYRGSSDEIVGVESSKIPLQEIYNYCINYKEFKNTLESQMREVEKAADEAIRLINSLKIKNESSIYSFVKESQILLEEEKQNNEPVTKGSGVKVNSNNDNLNSEENIKKSITDSNKNIDSCKLYVRSYSSFLFAKMSIAEEAYKAYMFILRRHIDENIKSNKSKVSTSVQNKEEKKEVRKDNESPTEKGKSGILKTIVNKIQKKNTSDTQ